MDRNDVPSGDEYFEKVQQELAKLQKESEDSDKNSKKKKLIDEAEQLKYEFQEWNKQVQELQEPEIEYRPAASELMESSEIDAVIDVVIEDSTRKNGIAHLNGHLLFVEGAKGAKKGMRIRGKIIWLNHDAKTGWLRPVDRILHRE